MFNFLSGDLFSTLAFIIGLVVAITIHEFSHAWAAEQLGDPTARLSGRLSLNPLAHLDPMGTLALFLVGFGWGKPVPIDEYNLRHPRRDAALISLAGPGSNLILAAILGLILRLPSFTLSLSHSVTILIPIIVLNVGLAVFNLLPVGPLDGAKIVLGLLPKDIADEWEETLERYGLILLLFVLFPMFSGNSLAGMVISPVINLILKWLLPISFI